MAALAALNLAIRCDIDDADADVVAVALPVLILLLLALGTRDVLLELLEVLSSGAVLDSKAEPLPAALLDSDWVGDEGASVWSCWFALRTSAIDVVSNLTKRSRTRVMCATRSFSSKSMNLLDTP
jgi:hypothetical protein